MYNNNINFFTIYFYREIKNVDLNYAISNIFGAKFI